MYKFLISALVGSLLITACGGGEDTPATGTGGSAYAVASVGFDLETQNTAAVDGDIDDPAIWAHATDRSKSLIIASAKDGGLRVYDLAGKQVQSIASNILVHDTAGKSRFNNVDVVYGFKLADGTSVDLAVATDRGQDLIRVWIFS